MSDANEDRGDDFVPTDEASAQPPVEEKAAEAPAPQDKAAEAPTTEEGDDDDTPTVMIPKHRYDTAARLRREAEERARRLEAEVASLKAARPADAPAPAPAGAAQPSAIEQLEEQIADLDREIAKAAADGETDRQVELMGKARKLDRQLVSAQLEASVAERIQSIGPATIEDLRYDEMVAAAEHEHPEINPDAENYDEAKAAEVIELKDAFEARGARATAALEKALRYVFGEREAKPTKPVGEGRKPDLRKAADAANKLPPDITATGLDGDRAGKTTVMPTVEKLSDADFAALPQETLRRLRGDFV